MTTEPTSAPRDHAGPQGFWFVFMAATVFCGEALGYVACFVEGAFPPRLIAWAVLAGVAALVGGIAAVLLNWLLLDRYRQLRAEISDLRVQARAGQALALQLDGRAEQQRRMRHDIRGALSPALLMSDRLIASTDPTIKRAGEIVVRCVDRATSLLADPVEPASPPAGP